MLGVIFFSLLFGYAISKIESNAGAILSGFWNGIFQVMLRITHIIMKFLPLGVFCLVAKVFATTGVESLERVGLFTVDVYWDLRPSSLRPSPLAQIRRQGEPLAPFPSDGPRSHHRLFDQLLLSDPSDHDRLRRKTSRRFQ